MLRRFHRGYLLIGLILIALTLWASLILFPEWNLSARLIAVLVVTAAVVVVNFVASFRQAFEKQPAPPPQSSAPNIQAGRDANIGEVVVGDQTVTQNAGGDIVGRDKVTNIYQAAPSPGNFLHQLPRPPDDFTGREAELTELLAHFDKGATISGLRGMGGIGKTALALKLAAELTTRYPDAQFFLDLQGTSDSPLTPAAALAHVVRAYHPQMKLPESEGELKGLYQAVLSGQRALLLMDNARDAAQVLPLALRAAGSLLAVTPDLSPAEYAAQLRDERARLERIGAEGVQTSVEASFNLSYAHLPTEAAARVSPLCLGTLNFGVNGWGNG